MRLCILTILVVGLFFGSYFAMPIQPVNQKEKKTSENGTPESAITVGPNDRNGTGSNLGLFGEAQLRMTNTTYPQTQYWIQTPALGNHYRQGPFGPYMPRATAGTNWKVGSVSTVAYGLRDVNNWMPSTDFSSGWTPPSTDSSQTKYSDTYFSPTNQVTENKQVLTASGSASSHPTQAGSTAFATSSPAGYLEVDAARRQYTFRPGQGANRGDLSITPNVIQGQSGTDMKRRWGYRSDSTYNWVNPGGEAGTTGYPGNYDSGTPTDNSQLVSLTSGWTWGDSQCNNDYGVTPQSTANSQGWYDTYAYAQRFVRLWYTSTKTTTSASTYYAVASAAWDRVIQYSTTATQAFYYNAESGQNAHNARFSANVLFTGYNAPLISGEDNDEFSGQIRYSIQQPGGGITNFKDVSFNQITDFRVDTIHPDYSVSNQDLSSYFSQTGLYQIHIYVRILARVRSTGWLSEKTGANFPRGSTGTSTVNFPYDYHRVGIRVRVSNIQTVVQDEIQINNGLGQTEAFFVSNSRQFGNRYIAQDGIMPKLEFDYMIRPGILGYLGSGSNNGLTAKLAARLQITHSNGTVFTLTKQDSLDWASIRGANNGYGTNCYRFSWILDSTEISRLNNASSFTILIGLIAPITWEMDFSMTPGIETRVYIKNANFTFTTIPRVETVGLRLHFLRQGDDFSQTEFAWFVSNPDLSGSVTLTGTKLANYNPIAGDALYFSTSQPSLLFSYNLTINITYESWDVPTQFIYKNGVKTYFISNFTFVTPHPVSSLTTRWYNPTVLESFNDNFNLTFVLPKFTQSGLIYWQIENVRDKSNPDYSEWLPTTDPGYYWTLTGRQTRVFNNQNPPNIYGNTTLNSGKIQTMRMDILLYQPWTYTQSGVALNLLKNLSLDMTFSHPSSIVSVHNNQTSSFTGHQSVYFRGVNIFSRANMIESITSLGTKNVAFYLYKSNLTSVPLYVNNVTFTTESVRYSSTSFNTNSINDANLGDDFISMALVNVSNICGVPKDATNPNILGGVYRGGIVTNTLGIFSTTQFGNLSYYYIDAGGAITGNLSLRNSNEGTNWDPSYTMYFDTPNRVGQRLEIRVDYRNDIGQPIIGANAKFSAYYYSNEGTVYKKIIPVVNNVNMRDFNNGTYGIILDPSANFPNSGNISQAFHIYNISLSKDNFAPQTFSRNFSIAVPTKLLITNPPFGSYYLQGGKYYMNFEGEKLLAGFVYSWSATYKVDATNGSYITNNYGNYYEGQVFMTYNLSSISEFDNPAVIKNLSAYVNYSYFMNQASTNQTWLYEDLNPVNGTFKSFDGDTTFYAQMRWPNFQSDYYTNSPSLTEWGRQTNGTTFLLHYNVIAKVRVNRTGYSEDISGRFFQPNDVVYQECAPFEGQNTTDFSVQRETNLRLISPTNGNWTRIIPMNRPEDGNPYIMGAFNNDSENIMDFDNSKKDNKTITWQPNFVIENYRNNLTVGADRFRIRVMLNCSVSDVAEANEWFAGYKDNETFVPIGPLNSSTFMYGVNQTAASLTSITLSGWNGTQLNFTADSGVMWSSPINFKHPNGTIQNIIAYGQSYVSDWIYWNSTTVGQKELVITAIKQNYIFSQVRITANVRVAPTKIFNASTSNPVSIPEADFTFALKEFRTKIGIGRSLVINFTDMTNHGIMKYLPVTNATIKITSDTKMIYGLDETGETWNYTELGNGLYNITLKYMDWPWDQTPEVFTLWFELSRANYNTTFFGLNVIVDKRNIEISIVDYMNSTMIYPNHPNAPFGQVLSTSYTNVTLRFRDLELNQYMNFSEFYIRESLQVLFFDTTNSTTVDGTSYLYTPPRIVRWTRSGEPVFNITFYPIQGQDSVGIHNVSLAFRRAMNYSNAEVQYNFEIKKRNAIIELVNNESEVEYYVENEILKGPGFRLYYRDSTFIDSNGRLITFSAGELSMNANFTAGRYDIITDGTESFNGITYFFSKIRFNTVNMSVGELWVNSTLSKPYYNNVSVETKIIIKNATAAITLVEYDLSQTKVFDESSWTFRYTVPINVPWDYRAQFRFQYEKNGILTDNPPGSMHMAIENLVAPAGVQIYLRPDIACLYFFTNITESDPTPISFTVIIWKDNYQPVQRNINITVINRETMTVMTPPVKDISFRGKIRFNFNFYDISTFTNPIPIVSAILYFNSTEVPNGNYSFYDFNGKSARVDFRMVGSNGDYIIDLDTANLSAGYYYTFTAEVGKDHYNKKLINHTFYIRPTRIEGNIFFTQTKSAPELSQNYLNIITLQPDVEYFYIWVKPYVEITSTTSEAKDMIYLTGADVSITIIVKDDTKLDSTTNQTVLLKTFELEYDETTGFFFGEFSVKWMDGLEEKQLSTISSFVVNMTSKNPSYTWNIVTGRVLILKGGNDLPGWFYILLAITVGAAVSMGSYGIKQMLKWRIPYVLRMIDESIEQIKNDKMPPVGVMTGRTEFVIKQVLEYLDQAGIVWSISDKFEESEGRDEDEESEGETKSSGKPYSHEELVALLAKIESITADERALFIEELKRMDRKAQEEFLQSLREE